MSTECGVGSESGRWETPDAAGRRLGVSKWTIYRHIGARKLTALRVGRQWRVERQSVDAYLAANTITAGGI